MSCSNDDNVIEEDTEEYRVTYKAYAAMPDFAGGNPEENVPTYPIYSQLSYSQQRMQVITEGQGQLPFEKEVTIQAALDDTIHFDMSFPEPVMIFLWTEIYVNGELVRTQHTAGTSAHRMRYPISRYLAEQE